MKGMAFTQLEVEAAMGVLWFSDASDGGNNGVIMLQERDIYMPAHRPEPPSRMHVTCPGFNLNSAAIVAPAFFFR